MMSPLTILQVSPSDAGGGAERVAHGLHAEYVGHGHRSRLVVARRYGSAAGVVAVTNGHGAWRAHDVLRRRGRFKLARAAKAVADPASVIDYVRGREDFRWPATRALPHVGGERPNILQLHNLHASFFDLRELPRLSALVPTVLSPHDEWLATGHCAYTLGCERWLDGCGGCPHLDVYPALRRDGTAGNLARKRELYARARLRVAVPCHWLGRVLERSILAPAIVELRLIPNGVDLEVFRPGGAAEARRRLGIAVEDAVIVFAAVGGQASRFKDYPTFVHAVRRLGPALPRPVTAFVLGSSKPHVRAWPGATLVDVPAVEPAVIAQYLRAADVYVHAAHAETFPLAVLEALACGTPVVATAVGGIPEQVSAASGILVPPRDAEALAAAVERLLRDPAVRAGMSAEAARDAAARFGRSRQAEAYLDWFRELAEMTAAC
jgi:glycosyltransferase involved in cell wall biosynthesis